MIISLSHIYHSLDHIINMNLFKQVATYFRKQDLEGNEKEPTNCKPPGNSIEVLVTEILEEPPSEDFQLLGSPRDPKESEENEQEVV